MHPLLHLIVREPKLLAEHAEAYAELFGEEFTAASAQLKRRALLATAGVVCLVLGTVLAGVAVLLWAAVPPDTMNAPWALVLAPLIPLAAAAGCLLAAKSEGPAAFDTMRRQLREDMALLREARAS